MQSPNPLSGKRFHGEVSSADASAGVAFVLYDSEGATITLGSSQRLIINSYQLVTVPGGNCAITVITDAAGKRLRKGTFAANGGMAGGDCEIFCPDGVTPKVFAPAGQVDAQIEGRIVG